MNRKFCFAMMALFAMFFTLSAAAFAANNDLINFVYNGRTYTVRWHEEDTSVENVNVMPVSYMTEHSFEYSSEYAGFLDAQFKAVEAYAAKRNTPSLGDDALPLWALVFAEAGVVFLIATVRYMGKQKFD